MTTVFLQRKPDSVYDHKDTKKGIIIWNLRDSFFVGMQCDEAHADDICL